MAALQCATARNFVAFQSTLPGRARPNEVRGITLRMPASLALRRPVPIRAQAAEVTEAKAAKKRAPKTKAAGAEGTRKTKKKKDKDEPKRGLSAFMWFSQANREKVRAENPGIAVTQVAKVLGEKWAAVKPADRKPYEDQAAQDKKRYETEIAAYRAKQQQ